MKENRTLNDDLLQMLNGGIPSLTTYEPILVINKGTDKELSGPPIYCILTTHDFQISNNKLVERQDIVIRGYSFHNATNISKGYTNSIYKHLRQILHGMNPIYGDHHSYIQFNLNKKDCILDLIQSFQYHTNRYIKDVRLNNNNIINCLVSLFYVIHYDEYYKINIASINYHITNLANIIIDGIGEMYYGSEILKTKQDVINLFYDLIKEPIQNRPRMLNQMNLFP